MNKEIFVNCPHCNNPILILQKDINCAIFRHGIYKTSGQQINPHEKKEICDSLKREELIYGCGKPFRLVLKNNTYEANICDYI